MSVVEDVVSRLVTPANVSASVVLWLAVEAARAALPGVFRRPGFKRTLPILPEIVGAAAYGLLPALAAPGASITERLMVGIVVGTGSSKVHSVIRQSLLGRDADIAAARSGGAAPAEGKPAAGGSDDGTTRGGDGK